MPAANPRFNRARMGFAGLRARVETLISGRAPNDPLYVTNRTWRQKLAVAAVAAVPVVMLTGLVMIGATDVFRSHKVDPYDRPLSETQKAAAPPAHLPDPTLTPADLDVVNMHIVRDGHAAMVTGVVRNNTGEKVASAGISYYLAGADGSLLGTDRVDVENVAPHSSVTFHLPMKVPKAEYVLVREVHRN